MADDRETRDAAAERERARVESVTAYVSAELAEADAVNQMNSHAEFGRDLAGAQHAAVNLISADDQITIAASEGIARATRTREDSICGRILDDAGVVDAFVTGDARTHPKLQDNPWVAREDGVRFYAGAPLVGREGLSLGMLCVWSSEVFSEEEAERAGRRLLPLRDGVVAVLEAQRVAHEEQTARTGPQPVAAVGLPAAEVPHVLGIADVIDDCAIRTVFQPIVHLASRDVAGFEAFSRGPVGTALESPAALIAEARAAGRLGELDWLCRASSLQAAARSGLPSDVTWFLNVEPAGLEADCPVHLRPALDQARATLRVVLEISERDSAQDVTRLLHATDRARRHAWGVALDDVGSDAVSLALLPFIQPEIVKLDMTLLKAAPLSTAAEIGAAVRAYSERTGATILAECVETEEQAEQAAVFGATYGQGYLFGAPAPLPASLPVPAHPLHLHALPQPLAGATPFEVLHNAVESQHARLDYLAPVSMRLRSHAQNSFESSVALALFDSQDRYERHTQVWEEIAERNCLSVCLVPGMTGRRSLFRQLVTAPAEGSRLHGEYALVVVTPQYAGAIVMRPSDRVAADGTALVEYIYSQDRTLVIAAGRAFLEHVQSPTPGSEQAPSGR